jgi:putative glycerol-1-phosphate prenyltransferase
MDRSHNLYQQFSSRKKSLAILIDPDSFTKVEDLLGLINLSVANEVAYFFIGGSLITKDTQRLIIHTIKHNCDIPVVLFPGSNMHIDTDADGILFLSLISGRNAELLIGQHVSAAPLLKKAAIEVLSTGYMLINGGNDTAVAYMSGTIPIPREKNSIAIATALAGEMLGMKLTYMDAGSGAQSPITSSMISGVRAQIDGPLIIGGGINTVEKAMLALAAGAGTIVIGNAIEKDPSLLAEVSFEISKMNKELLNIH